MRDPLEYRKAKFVMYTVMKSINNNDVKSLIKMMKKVYDELGKKMRDIEDSLIDLRSVNTDSLFSIPPFENMKISFENTEYHINNLVDLFKNILTQLELMEKGSNTDIQSLVHLFPDRRKGVSGQVLNTPTPRLIRKKIAFKDIKENFNDFVKQHNSLKERVYELMNYADLYLTLTHGFIYRNFNTDQSILLEEYIDEEMGNLAIEFKLRVSASNYIIWNVKNFKKDYNITKAMLTEFNKGIRKGGI